MKEFETNEEIIYALIIDDLDETISAADKLVLNRWRTASAANEKVYQEFVAVHVNMDKLLDLRGYDPQSSWEALDQKISSGSVLAPIVTGRNKKNRLWYGIAASILILLSMGYYFGFYNQYEVIRTESKSARIVLPDSTRIDLNSATVIRYNKRDFIKNRKLELINGEVFISVTNHKLSQFKVILGELEALDIGTNFNIVKTDKAIHVIVEDGAVALAQPSLNKKILLTAGKRGSYDLNTRALTASDNLNANYKSWITKEFIFNEIPLSDVASDLSKVYKEFIVISGAELKSRKFTAKLHYQTLDSVIAVISASLQCKAVKSDDKYILSKD